MSKLAHVTREKDRLTRVRAEKELTAGANPRLEKYTKHVNKHVRVKAAKHAARWVDLDEVGRGST